MENCGHWSQYEDPETFNSIFLESCSPVTQPLLPSFTLTQNREPPWSLILMYW